jgi:hypothetical protein
VKQLLGLFFSVLLVAIFRLGTCEVAHAQQATGRIIGNVTDPSGAGVPGVQVKSNKRGHKGAKLSSNGRERYFCDRVCSFHRPFQD